MNITREMLADKLSQKSGYYKKDIRYLLQCLDNVVVECFDEATEDEEITVQVVEGIKIECKILPRRDRVAPATQEPIVCEPAPKVFVKFSQPFKNKIQKRYEEHNM